MTRQLVFKDILEDSLNKNATPYLHGLEYEFEKNDRLIMDKTHAPMKISHYLSLVERQKWVLKEILEHKKE